MNRPSQRVAERSDHEVLTFRLWHAGRRAHPGVPLALEDFAFALLATARRRLRRASLPEDDENISRLLAPMPAADIHLAMACDLGTPGSWERLLALHLPRLHRLARHLGASFDDADDVVRSLPGDLCRMPPDGSTRTRMGTYDGSGSLGGWLGVIVARRLADRPHVNLLRLDGRELECAVRDRADALPREACDDDPSHALLAAESAVLFGAALRTAWSGLSSNEALAVPLRFRDGLAQKDIATILGVGEPRVSRILQSALDKLRLAVADVFPSGIAGRGGLDATRDALLVTLDLYVAHLAHWHRHQAGQAEGRTRRRRPLERAGRRHGEPPGPGRLQDRDVEPPATICRSWPPVIRVNGRRPGVGGYPPTVST